VLPATRQRWHSRPYPSRSWYSIKWPRRDARLSWPSWLVTYRNGIPARRQSPIQVLTWARRALTSFMRRTTLTTTPRRQHGHHFTYKRVKPYSYSDYIPSTDRWQHLANNTEFYLNLFHCSMWYSGILLQPALSMTSLTHHSEWRG